MQKKDITKTSNTYNLIYYILISGSLAQNPIFSGVNTIPEHVHPELQGF